MEGGNINNNNNNNSSTGSMMMENGLLYPMIMIPHPHHHHNHNHTHQNQNPNNLKFSSSNSSSPSVVAATAAAGCYDLMDMETTTHNPNPNSNTNNNGSIKAKILAHPHYPRLLSAYLNCQKVGAPPEVVAKLEEAEGMAVNQRGGGYIGEDPGLDQFMEAYCEMLSKYEQELTKPYKEAMLFLSRIECQFKTLTLFSSSDSPSSACGDGGERNGGSSEEDIDVNNGLFIDPSAEDRELKGQLLRKYSGYLGSLRQEFMKKKKKGKLPKEARQQLLEWWTRHYKWPYPSESQKLALAESTGLDQKQINNWFINQRKRHWKPSEDMQFMVMDAASHPHGHTHPHFSYMDTVLGNPFPMDVSSTLM